MAGLVFGNGIKLTSSIKSINFRILFLLSSVHQDKYESIPSVHSSSSRLIVRA